MDTIRSVRGLSGLLVIGLSMATLLGCGKETAVIDKQETGGSQMIIEDGENNEKNENTINVITVENEVKEKAENEPKEAEVQKEENEDGTEISVEEEFYISEITDDIFSRIEGKSYKEDCTIPREDLRYLHVLNKDKDGLTHEGEMIVNVRIAEDVLEILRELYKNDYAIEKIRLVDEYDADDEASMQDNNSSAFNFRTIPGSKKLSNHARGLAIDINPRYNPYIRTRNGKTLISPDNGVEYADRESDYDYKINKGDLCYTLFTEHGFEWGGEWKNSKDYQHFEMPDQ